MKYSVQYSKNAQKQIKKLDRYTMMIVVNWISKNLDGCESPREHGKALGTNRKGQWRYRIGDYRLICLIEDSALVIIAINIGHRRETLV